MLDDLVKKVSEFEAASESVRSARLDHIGARTDLDVITGELSDLVRVLDSINRYRYGKDPVSMAEWTAAKEVPFQPKTVGVVPPVCSGGVAPAA